MEGYSREEAETKHPDPSFTTGDSEEDREKLTNVSSLSSLLEGNLEVEKLVKCPGRFEEAENIVGRAEKAEVLRTPASGLGSGTASVRRVSSWPDPREPS